MALLLCKEQEEGVMCDRQALGKDIGWRTYYMYRYIAGRLVTN